MDQQNSLSEQNRLKKLRSNSIRKQSPLANIGFSAKLNSKKFPLDFFGKEPKKMFAARILCSQRLSVQRNKENKHFDLFEQPECIQNLPEAQVTCFFKASENYSGTQDTSASRNCNLQNETKVSVSEFECILSKQVCSSTQINQQNQNMDLCWTFSKIPKSFSKMGTPQRKQKQTQVQLQSVSQCSSAKFNRPQTRQQGKVNNLGRSRKNSMDRMGQRRNQAQTRISNNRSSVKKTILGEQIYFHLPKIGKKPN